MQPIGINVCQSVLTSSVVCVLCDKLGPQEDELVCPHDAEVSYDELEFLCKSAKAWRKGGARRHVTITEHSSMVNVDEGRKPKKGAALVRKKKRATVTRVWIEQVASDGTRAPYADHPARPRTRVSRCRVPVCSCAATQCFSWERLGAGTASLSDTSSRREPKTPVEAG